jgi:hypothetical protein
MTYTTRTKNINHTLIISYSQRVKLGSEASQSFGAVFTLNKAATEKAVRGHADIWVVHRHKHHHREVCQKTKKKSKSLILQPKGLVSYRHCTSFEQVKKFH